MDSKGCRCPISVGKERLSGTSQKSINRGGGIKDFGCVLGMGYDFGCVLGCDFGCIVGYLRRLNGWHRWRRSRREIPRSWYLHIPASQKGNIQTITCNVTRAAGIILRKGVFRHEISQHQKQINIPSSSTHYTFSLVLLLDHIEFEVNILSDITNKGKNFPNATIDKGYSR